VRQLSRGYKIFILNLKILGSSKNRRKGWTSRFLSCPTTRKFFYKPPVIKFLNRRKKLATSRYTFFIEGYKKKIIKTVNIDCSLFYPNPPAWIKRKRLPQDG